MLNRIRSMKLVSVALCAALGTASTHGAELRAYEMASYTNGPGGEELLAGDYDGAIAAIGTASSQWRDSIELLRANTNLCVAYTARHELPAARDVCFRALQLARDADDVPGTAIRRGTETAKALSNRGVLKALSGDVGSAAADFRAAVRMGGALSGASSNLAHLEASQAYRQQLARTAD